MNITTIKRKRNQTNFKGWLNKRRYTYSVYLQSTMRRNNCTNLLEVKFKINMWKTFLLVVLPFLKMFKISPSKELYCAYWRIQLLPCDLIFSCVSQGFYFQKMSPKLIIRILFHQKHKLNNETLLLHEYCYISKSYCLLYGDIISETRLIT